MQAKTIMLPPKGFFGTLKQARRAYRALEGYNDAALNLIRTQNQVMQLKALTPPAAAADFDFKAYKATVTKGTDPLLAGINVDSNVTWCSQWGKLVDLTFRFVTVADNSVVQFTSPVIWAHIDGIGITMSGYKQPVTMLIGTAAADPDADDVTGTLYPFEIVMTDPDDFTKGYDLKNMLGITMNLRRSLFVKGNEQLITRTYFKDGVLTYSPDDFS